MKMKINTEFNFVAMAARTIVALDISSVK